MAGTAFGVSKPALMKSGLKGTGETMQHAGGEKMHTLSPHYNKPKFPTPAPYHGNTKDTGGKPPKSLKKKNLYIRLKTVYQKLILKLQNLRIPLMNLVRNKY